MVVNPKPKTLPPWHLSEAHGVGLCILKMKNGSILGKDFTSVCNSFAREKRGKSRGEGGFFLNLLRL